MNDICASVSAAITDVLLAKLKRAVKKEGVKNVMLAGGVSANSMLRKKVSDFAESRNLNLMIPALQYCTDNAAMIAMTGALKARDGKFDDYRLKPYARVS
ncbi:MAG: hypothetical protein U5K35_17370 [Rhodohalobacter sp.]|nr:hypothetical protein [Rhodohalobacter sp.]MDZ7758175.1 hypothetical protein [Rhodohalobacter sp.]